MSADRWVPDAVHHDPDNPQHVYAMLARNEYGLPHYTTSLDAAVTLMVEGAMMRNTRQHADLWMVRYVNPHVGGNAKTEPMARCAAALRARAALAEQSREPMQSGEAKPPPQGSAP